MSSSYYQDKLDGVNTAITALEAGESEARLADGRMVRNHDIASLYAERARLETELARVSRTRGGVAISRGAAA